MTSHIRTPRPNRIRRRRRASAGLLSGALICTVMTGSNPAHAMDPATALAVAGYIKKAYDLYKQGRAMFGDSGPTLAQQLAQVQSAVIGELRTQRNLALQSNANTVFALFRNLADNARTDPTNAGLYNNILTLQYQTAIAMQDIVNFANDPKSSYELAPAMNTLLATGTGVLRMKGEIWLSFPSSWADHHYWLLAGVHANYTLIRSQYHQCWPGYNPGWAGPMPAMPPAVYDWLEKMQPGTFEQSQLYKYLMNKSFNTGRYDWTATCSYSGRTVRYSGTDKTFACNPVTDTCSKACPIQLTLSATRTTDECPTSMNMLQCAHSLARKSFAADPIVRIVRDSTEWIMRLSGGNQAQDSSNNSLLSSGKYVDPWVHEPACTSVDGPWAYPQRP